MESPHRKKVREFMARPPFSKRGLTDEQTDLFCAALTHDSYSNESGTDVSYERLEFLGDSVIELVICEHIFRNGNESEGNMTQMKQEIVANRKMSASIIRSGIDIDDVMLVGNGHVDRVTGKSIPEENMRADSFEALMGAFYLTFGLEDARRAVEYVLL